MQWTVDLSFRMLTIVKWYSSSKLYTYSNSNHCVPVVNLLTWGTGREFPPHTLSQKPNAFGKIQGLGSMLAKGCLCALRIWQPLHIWREPGHLLFPLDNSFFTSFVLAFLYQQPKQPAVMHILGFSGSVHYVPPTTTFEPSDPTLILPMSISGTHIGPFLSQ